MTNAKDQSGGKPPGSRAVYLWALAIAVPTAISLAVLSGRDEGTSSDRSDEETPSDAEERALADALPARAEGSEPVSPAAASSAAASAQPLPEPVVLAPERAQAGVRLLEQAKVAEEGADYQQASALYVSAARKFGGSSEAYEAAFAAAELNRVKLNDPKRALKLYRQAHGLRPEGWRREEVLIGLALTARAAKDDLQELQAWSELSAQFPASGYAIEAQQRLSVLIPQFEKANQEKAAGDSPGVEGAGQDDPEVEAPLAESTRNNF